MNFILTSIARFSTHPKYPLSKPERIIAHVFATFTIFACEVHREKAKNERRKKATRKNNNRIFSMEMISGSFISLQH